MGTTERRVMENKDIVRRFIEEGFDEGRDELIDELLDEDFVGYESANPEPIRGPEGFRQIVETYRSAFPDIEFTIHNLVAEDDWVTARWTASGTHEGELMGIEPTGQRVENVGMEFNRVRDGKIVEGYVVWDALGMLQQLGAMPDEHGS